MTPKVAPHKRCKIYSNSINNSKLQTLIFTMKQTIKIKPIHPAAVIPEYKTAGAACFDLHAIVEAPDQLGATGVDGASITIAPGNAATFRTGLTFEIPEGWVLKIFSRSGHGFKDGVRLANGTGVIDADYRGEVQVALHNDHRGKRFTVRHGDRIAQAMLERAEQHEIVVVDELSTTARGTAGFGSTGV